MVQRYSLQVQRVFVVCLVVQKLIFKKFSSVGMCSIKVQMLSKAQTTRGLCRMRDGMLEDY